MLTTMSGDLVEADEYYHTVGAGVVLVTKICSRPLSIRYKVYLKSLTSNDYNGLLKGRGYMSYEATGKFCTKEHSKKFAWHLVKKVVNSTSNNITKGLAKLKEYENAPSTKWRRN